MLATLHQHMGSESVLQANGRVSLTEEYGKDSSSPIYTSPAPTSVPSTSVPAKDDKTSSFAVISSSIGTKDYNSSAIPSSSIPAKDYTSSVTSSSSSLAKDYASSTVPGSSIPPKDYTSSTNASSFTPAKDYTSSTSSSTPWFTVANNGKSSSTGSTHNASAPAKDVPSLTASPSSSAALSDKGYTTFASLVVTVYTYPEINQTFSQAAKGTSDQTPTSEVPPSTLISAKYQPSAGITIANSTSEGNATIINTIPSTLVYSLARPPVPTSSSPPAYEVGSFPLTGPTSYPIIWHLPTASPATTLLSAASITVVNSQGSTVVIPCASLPSTGSNSVSLVYSTSSSKAESAYSSSVVSGSVYFPPEITPLLPTQGYGYASIPSIPEVTISTDKVKTILVP
ncbi:MAG: hypothetical protein M1830_008819, partial [Pleopsidium flavum]